MQWTYKVTSAGVVRRRRQHLADDGDATARDDVEAPLLRLAAVPRVGDGVDAGQEVGRGREQQGLDVAEAEGLDDRGEEVCGDISSITLNVRAGIDTYR